MKKNLVTFALAAMTAVVIAACIDGIPTNPFLQLPTKAEINYPVIPLPEKVSYTIVIDMIDNEQDDTVTAAPETGGAGDSITLEYTVADSAHYNLLYFSGVTAPIDSVDGAGSGARTYTVNADDAINGIIIIIAAFEHTDLTPDPITFTDTAPIITETYGETFTNAVCAEHSGAGAVTYSSSDETVAEVDNAGEVTIHKVGSAVITASKEADAVYAHASASYTLHIAPKAVTITVTVSNKTYNGSTAAAVTGTTINGNLDGGNLTVVAGTAVFANANAGNNKAVTFSGWTLGGSAAGNYILSAQPASVTANITKANPTVTWPTGLTGYYGLTLANISLPGNGSGSPAGTFTWTTSSTSAGDLGTRAHNMTFTPTNTTNYNTVTQNVSIVVRLVEMVNINSGTFTMGAPSTETGTYSDERPQRQVTLSAFSLGKYELTQAQYERVMGTNPSNFTTGADAGETQSRRPVEQVSWYDALVFCNKLSMLEGLSPAYRINNSTDPAAWGTIPTSSNAAWDAVVMVSGSNGYRLPTEAQWEYACRAGTTTAYNTGATINTNTGWYDANSGSKTHEVGKKPPNAWGLYDMHGNVWEWCWDWFGTYPSAAQTDPVGASSGSNRVGRGGSWYNPARSVRSADRGGSFPNRRDFDLGFRVLRP